mmetsp:Transcript_57337/g.123065  ORF Transcript_57337/g.123065 Transcript_57337/m.123065 type:complete len:327 (-) Transcript_57337:292-1272(-)|eukprot:CAMPEP_0204318468 /NCGR_PEP_ID=MMETSP0469-20131031/6553_1 /ASSEMBLY_ACC=CAM_ASM_000384 /TAXON_ID=2969 /ORGANISM="Oxyrrhis marina" /LENGTH=326 /DNA_ID=CAMNT_0051299523 /DNA_START=108 /DNA_END=1088 /DNA_ORIENTATION=-
MDSHGLVHCFWNRFNQQIPLPDNAINDPKEIKYATIRFLNHFVSPSLEAYLQVSQAAQPDALSEICMEAAAMIDREEAEALALQVCHSAVELYPVVLEARYVSNLLKQCVPDAVLQLGIEWLERSGCNSGVEVHIRDTRASMQLRIKWLMIALRRVLTRYPELQKYTSQDFVRSAAPPVVRLADMLGSDQVGSPEPHDAYQCAYPPADKKVVRLADMLPQKQAPLNSHVQTVRLADMPLQGPVANQRCGRPVVRLAAMFGAEKHGEATPDTSASPRDSSSDGGATVVRLADMLAPISRPGSTCSQDTPNKAHLPAQPLRLSEALML